MSCDNCTTVIQDVGAISFRTCTHLVCLECLTALAGTTTTKTILCVVNSGIPKGNRLRCGGFLNEEDLESAISEEEFKSYERRLETGAEDLDPTFSTASSESNGGSEEDEAEQDSADLATFELTTGWGQVASQVAMLQESGLSFEKANLELDLLPLWVTQDSYEGTCIICLDDVQSGEGIILRGCFHVFCRGCLVKQIEHCTEPEIQCAYQHGGERCDATLTPREVYNLVPNGLYRKHYEELSLKEAEKVGGASIFHCLTPNCPEFWFADDGVEVGVFVCPTCRARNCTVCKVVHPGSCQNYWMELDREEERMRQAEADEQNRVQQRINDRLSQDMIHQNINTRNFMRCPLCQMPCYKFTGCNHVVCASCKHKFNWAGNEPRQFR